MAKSEEEKYKGNEKVLKQLDVVKRKELELTELKKAQKKLDKETQESNKKWIDQKEANLNKEKQTLGYFKQQAQEAKKIQDGFDGATKSFARLSSNVRQSLSENKSGGGIYLGLQRQILQLEEAKFDLTDEQRTQNLENASFAKTITDSLLQQAEATETARAALFGQTKLEKKIEEIELRRAELGDNLADKLVHAIHLTEQLELKEERLTEIKEAQKELYEEAPESLKSAIDFTKKLGKAMTSGPLVAIVLVAAALAAGIEAFKELDKATEDYSKTTGMTAKQTYHLAHDAHEIEISFRKAGVELKHVFDVANDLGNVFGDMTHFSQQTLGALAGIQARTGVTSETAAKVQGVFEQVAGYSGETAASLQQQIASLAQQGKVSPKEVLEDIAENAEATSTFFKGDVTALKNQVIQAHQLGTTLTKVAKTAEALLDFESGIEDELLAATFVGGQFNLSTARGLAYAGKTVEAQEEILNQLNQGVGFRNQDIFAQKALAKAAGMSIEDINKQLTMKEKLAHLSGEDKKNAEAAIAAGLDVKDLNDEQLKQKTDEFIKGQKINGQITDLENSFKSIVATVGGALTPLFTALGPILQAVLLPVELMAKGFGTIVHFVKEYSGILGTIAIIMGTLYAYQKAIVISQKAEAFWRLMSMRRAAATASLTALSNPAKALIGLGVASLVVGAAASMMAGDIKSPADGKTQVSTKEGGLFTLSPNDDLVAAPGAAAKMDMASKIGKGGNVISSNNDGGKYMALLGRVDTLMQKLTTGGITAHAYMDGSKVTANVASNVNKSTRNNFALGQG
jgi:hypothetical protein